MNNPSLSPALAPRQTRLGFLWLAVSMVLLPVILPLCNQLLPTPLSIGLLNVVYYGSNFAATVGILHRFLWESAAVALKQLPRVLLFPLLGFLGYQIMTTQLTQLIWFFEPDFGNINDENIFSMLDADTIPLALATIFLVPLAEESIYRGLIFRNLLEKRPVVAYLVSMAAFASIHVTGYIGTASPLTLVLCFLQYLPAGLCLCFCYQQTGTIMTPILIHTIVNAVGICAYLR